MHEISLAFVWHQHQPYYADDVSGETPMPWVRLHGAKDYWGMAMHLLEIPQMHVAINFAPSLLVQIAAYVDQGRVDEHLRVSRLPADGLKGNDLEYLLDNFFMANAEQMIRPFRRYHELYQQRGFHVDSASRAARRFSARDILDLQCWSNLVWIHPLAFDRDADLAEFRRKGRLYTEAEKNWLLDKQLALLKEIIPLHRELAARGQVELTTTPFYHPILPLLWDKRLAREAMPDVPLPRHLEPYGEDGEEQIRRAVAYHERVFGAKPRGMWPSEGSVCQAMIPAIADAGIEWIAADEEILGRSTDGRVGRDPSGFVRHAELLYRPWRVAEQGRQLQVVFRDHALSDQIGFHYQRYSAQQAADDMVGRLEAIGAAVSAQHASRRPALVSVILDGENCWEHYPGGGVDFLRALYQRISQHPRIAPVRLRDYLEEHPAADQLGRLFPGSWIGHNFGIWIGHSECNRAWDLVSEARKCLVAAAKRRKKPTAQLARAWEELYIAEGSDWFWWYGDSHYSPQSDLFDSMFRKHLQNVYAILEEPVPAELLHAIRAVGLRRRFYSEPTGLLNVAINGRRTYFEWINAGHYQPSSGQGTMSMAERRRVELLAFGFDTERLLLSLEAGDGPVSTRFADVDAVRITFLEPTGCEAIIESPASAAPNVRLTRRGQAVKDSGQAAADSILEAAIFWKSLGLKTGDSARFFLELVREGKSLERIPTEGTIDLAVPSADFELMMWQA